MDIFKTKVKKITFAGITKDKSIFYVQIKENTNSRQKYFMSVFPENEKTFR